MECIHQSQQALTSSFPKPNFTRAINVTTTLTYLSETSGINWLELFPVAEVHVMFVDCAAGETDAVLIVVGVLQPREMRWG